MKDIFTNPTVVVPAIVWMIAQFLKFAAKAMKGDVSLKYFVKSGNMPSVHTAVVIALVVSIAAVESFESSIFGVALIFAMIVIYDALNVRRAVGEQGGILERLLQMQKVRLQKGEGKPEKLKVIEVLGHTPVEVAAGALVGMVGSLLLLHSYWPDYAVNYLWNYGITEKTFAKIALIVVLLISLTSYIYLKRHVYRKLPSAKVLASRIAYGLIIPSIFGLAVIWSYEVELALFEGKLWLILTVLWMVLYSVTALPYATSKFTHNRHLEAEELRRQKKQKRQSRRKK